MRRLIEIIKIHLWYDCRILKAKIKLMKASIKYNNNVPDSEMDYYCCRSYLYDLYFHRDVYLKEC